MTVSTAYPIKQALVHQLRVSYGPRSYVFPEGHAREGEQPLTGDWLFFGFAPEKTPMPHVTYQQVWGPRAYTWGSVMYRVGFDVKCFSENSVEAENLDALVEAALGDAELIVSGQSTLSCRRLTDLSSQETDEEGKKNYMAGGTYEVWTDQPIPMAVRDGFTAAAVIV